MTALRSPLRSPLQPALRAPTQLGVGGGDTPALNLPFSSLANSTGSDGRAASWWNLFRGGSQPDEYIDASTGALTYGAHNLALRSQELDNGTWARVAASESISANATTAPDGTTTAERVTRSGTTWWHGYRQSFTVSANTTYTISLHVKADTGSPGILLAAGATLDAGVYILGGVSTLRSDTGTQPITSHSSVALADGWYRIWITFNTAVATNIAIGTADGGAVSNAANFFWGAQLNLGTVATTYVPTTSAAIYSRNPRITYSRAGLATRIGPTGLVEYGPHNLRQASEDLTSVLVFKTGGTASATVFTASAGAGFHYTSANSIGVQTGVFSAAWEIRKTNNRWMFFGVLDSSLNYFDFDTGSLGTAPDTCTVTALENGWFRLTCSRQVTAATINAGMGLAASNGGGSFTAAGTESFEMRRAWVNIGPLQPYYPTGASAYYGPRITYDPATLSNLGFLVEGQAVNLVQVSTNLASGSWGVAGATRTVVAGTNPDGSGNVVRIAITSNVGNNLNQGYVAAASAQTGSLWIRGTAGQKVFFNVNSSGPSASQTLVTFTGTWERVTSVSSGTGATAYFACEIYNRAGGAHLPNVEFDVWGAQLEAGSAATSYIPNPTASTMTRVADSASMTGTDFSSWYVATQGAFLFTARIPAGDGYLFSVSDNTANNRISVRKSSGNLIYEVLSGGATQASISVSAPTVGTTAKIAVSFIGNLFSVAVNGSAGTDDTAGTVPTVSRLTIGSDHTPANHWNESAALTRYFKTSFAAAKLAALTT